jgi:nucleotide-binding universal stress UspA family protein
MSLDVKTILCAIAMSPSSEWVMLRALHEAGVNDAQIHVLHIIPSFDPAMAIPIVSFMGEDKFRALAEEHKKETVEAIRTEIEDLKRRILDEHLDETVDRIAEVHVYEGDPELEILNMAGQLKADLIVLGTHTKGLTQHTFMGSVARKVIKRAKVPILLVPPVTVP